MVSHIILPRDVFPKLKDAYLVGGSVRDLILGIPPADYDLAVRGDPDIVARKMARNLSGKVVALGNGKKALLRIVSQRAVVDVSAVKGDTVEADLNQRDFTIDAMACELATARLIDPLGGLADLAAGAIRMVSDSVFRQDPIRLLRAYRLAATLGFHIDPATAAAIERDSHLIGKTAAERVRDELLRLLGSSDAHRWVYRMAENGLMTAMIPEMEPLKTCTQTEPHCKDALTHTLSALHQLEVLLKNLDSALPNHAASIGRAMDPETAALLKCALLLHDVGKPGVRTENDRNRTRFYGHAQSGAEIAQSICRRLRFSNRQIRFISCIVAHHMRLLLLYQARCRNQLTPKGMTRLFLACGEQSPALFLHSIADHRAKAEHSDPAFERFIGLLLDEFFHFQSKRATPPLISGRDLIRLFGLSPSPRFKQILSKVEEKRLLNRISTRKEALALVRMMLRDSDPPAS